MPAGVKKPVKFMRGNARAAVKTLIFRLQRMRAFLEPGYLAQVGQPLNTPVQDNNIDEVIGNLQLLLQGVAFERYHGRA